MLPPALSRAAASAVPKGRAGTALAARMLAERRREEFTGMVQNADRIVAVSLWLFEALRRNGVPQEKLVLSRHGVAPDFAAEIRQRRRHVEVSPKRPLRLIYLGRLHPVKGVHVAVSALRALPRALPVTLTIHGVGSGAEEREYAAQIYAAAADDPRIVIAPSVPRNVLATVMMESDAIVVPSLWLETGPLVVLEAKAAGLPVIGSRLGGIAELVDEPDDGVLVAPGDVAAWASAIEAMAAAPRATRSPDRASLRTMREVAAEMADLYASLR
jgi:glycosyltransferase involved in cell wall biosynthesis